MSSLWNKTLFYLGLVDEEEQSGTTVESAVGDVTPLTPETSASSSSVGEPSRTTSVAKPGSGVSGRRVEPPAATRQRMSRDPVHAEAGVYVHPGGAGSSPADVPARRMEPESHIIAAKNFSDAQVLADAIRTGRSVVLDLRSAEPEMVRRIVDFASGLTYALDGKMSKTTQGVILVTPSGVSLGVAETERLATLGLFDTQD